jgi:prepilin-type processing-associated H-X9-DG protein
MESAAGSNLFRHFIVMTGEINNPRLLVCPADTRKAAPDFQHFSNLNLSYFVGLDTDETRPSMWLTGDRNLVTNGVPVVPGLVVLGQGNKVGWSQTMHKGAGNIGLADGSVQQASDGSLPGLLQKTGTNVNRLAVP